MFSEMPILRGFQRKSVKENRSKKLSTYTKIYHYWTDWHIVKPLFLRRNNVAGCSNNNHGLNSEKDSSAGL